MSQTYDYDPRANSAVTLLWKAHLYAKKHGEPASAKFHEELKVVVESNAWGCISAKNILRLASMCSTHRPVQPFSVLTRISMTIDQYENL